MYYTSIGVQSDTVEDGKHQTEKQAAAGTAGTANTQVSTTGFQTNHYSDDNDDDEDEEDFVRLYRKVSNNRGQQQ